MRLLSSPSATPAGTIVNSMQFQCIQLYTFVFCDILLKRLHDKDRGHAAAKDLASFHAVNIDGTLPNAGKCCFLVVIQKRFFIRMRFGYLFFFFFFCL